MNLDIGVMELKKSAERKLLDVTVIKPLSMEHLRIVRHNGEEFRVQFTKMDMGKSWGYMLSVNKPSAKDGLPEEPEAREIAEAFFPDGYTALDSSVQIITSTCRKFINTVPKEVT